MWFIAPDSYLIGVAEVNWDDDPRYGVGDYRIPKVMLTLPDNTRVDPPANKGSRIIYRFIGFDWLKGFDWLNWIWLIWLI